MCARAQRRRAASTRGTVASAPTTVVAPPAKRSDLADGEPGRRTARADVDDAARARHAVADGAIATRLLSNLGPGAEAGQRRDDDGAGGGQQARRAEQRRLQPGGEGGARSMGRRGWRCAGTVQRTVERPSARRPPVHLDRVAASSGDVQPLVHVHQLDQDTVLEQLERLGRPTVEVRPPATTARPGGRPAPRWLRSRTALTTSGWSPRRMRLRQPADRGEVVVDHLVGRRRHRQAQRRRPGRGQVHSTSARGPRRSAWRTASVDKSELWIAVIARSSGLPRVARCSAQRVDVAGGLQHPRPTLQVERVRQPGGAAG